jgi:hypothetical protein
MFCGEFSEAAAQLEKKTELVLDEAHDLRRVIDLFCGKQLNVNLQEALQMAEVADQYDISEVLAAIEEALILHVRTDNCLQIADHGCSAMPRLKEAAVKTAAFRFEEVMSDASRMGAGSLADLLGDDRLVATREEIVWAVVQEWVSQRIAAGRLFSDELRLVLGSVRFPLMQIQSLKAIDSSGWARARNIAAADAAWVGEMVKEALAAKASESRPAAGAESKFTYLKMNSCKERTGTGVDWEPFTKVAPGGQGSVRTPGLHRNDHLRAEPDGSDDDEVAESLGMSVCQLHGQTRIVNVTRDGLRVYSLGGQHLQNFLHFRDPESEDQEPWSNNRAQISAFGVRRYDGVAFTGDTRGRVLEWNLDTGECIASLEAPYALTVSANSRRRCGWIHELAVWDFGGTTYLAAVIGEMRRPAVWTQTGTRNPDNYPPWIELDLNLAGNRDHDDHVECWCLTGCDHKLLVGMEDGSIWVWETGQSVCGTTAPGRVTVTGKTGFDAHKPAQPKRPSKQTAWKYHPYAVVQMLVREGQLFSTSLDSTIRVWQVGTWILTQTIEATRRGVYHDSLIFSGTKLLGLEITRRDSGAKPLVVWGLVEGLWQIEHRVEVPHGLTLDSLIAVDGQVWGAAGEHLVVWGQHSPAVSSPPRST